MKTFGSLSYTDLTFRYCGNKYVIMRSYATKYRWALFNEWGLELSRDGQGALVKSPVQFLYDIMAPYVENDIQMTAQEYLDKLGF
jgi:hypothetical protein